MCEPLEEALVDVHFEELIREGNVNFGNEGIDLYRYIQPASLDVPLTSRCYLVKDKILPFGTTIRDVLNEIVLEEIILPNLEEETKTGPIFFKGHTYLAYCGKVNLPGDMRASLSPKSSIGRIDLMVRAVFDNCGFYDTIEKGGAKGELWMEISPRSFNIRLRAGLSLSQMMIFQESNQTPTTLPTHSSVTASSQSLCSVAAASFPPSINFHNFPVFDNTYNLVYNTSGNPLPIKLHNRALILSLNVPSHNLGFEALPTNEIIDLAKIGELDAARFFRPLTANVSYETTSKKRKSAQMSVTLEKDKFYVLATKERVSVPCSLSAEMVPFSQHIGELRAHYAGFFDPGFGFTKDSSIKGTIGVLEVRPHETIRVHDGQPIALMEFFRNKCEPKVPYGQAGNHYQHQTGPKLSKYFREKANVSVADQGPDESLDIEQSERKRLR